MAVQIIMPELGESVHEGTVSRWLKQEGEFVKEDEPVVEIMTDKVNTELQAPASGILKILIPEGSPVEVWAAMGEIEENGAAKKSGGKEPAPAPQAAPPAAAASPTSATEAPAPTVAAPAGAQEGDRKWFTPVVRAIAEKNSLSDAELETISGTGEGGRVTKKDVEAYLSTRGKTAPAAAPKVAAPQPISPKPTVAGPDQQIVPLAGMRKMIADAMVRSSQVPTVSTVTQCDVTNMVHFRERNKETFQETYGVKLTYTPFFIKAVTESLMEVPLVNASLSGEAQITMNNVVHIGVAVALGAKWDEGLILPVI